MIVEERVASCETAIGLFREAQKALFDKVNDIETKVDQNLGRAAARDVSLQEIKAALEDHKDELSYLKDEVKSMNRDLNNGLLKRVASMETVLEQIGGCLEHRKIEGKIRDEVKKHGIHGFLKPGWVRFKSQFAYLLIVGGFIILGTSVVTIIGWFLIWLFAKTSIFHEGPIALLKLFGVN